MSSCQADEEASCNLTDSEEDSEPELPDLPAPPVPGDLLCADLVLPEIHSDEEEAARKKGARRKEVGKRNLLAIPSTAEASLR